jgi:hypothetical protein
LQCNLYYASLCQYLCSANVHGRAFAIVLHSNPDNSSLQDSHSRSQYADAHAWYDTDADADTGQDAYAWRDTNYNGWSDAHARRDVNCHARRDANANAYSKA